MASASQLCFFLLFILPSIYANSEGDALIALQSRLIDPENALASWDPTLITPCTWFHVTCDSDDNVIRLDLMNEGLSGTLGPELGQLRNLKYLELYDNDLSGEIPTELGNLKNLLGLDLDGNNFQGQIPNSFANLASLKFLRLNNNKLTGLIPSQLTTLNNLVVFNVSNNELCGPIPVGGLFATFPKEWFEHNKLNQPC